MTKLFAAVATVALLAACTPTSAPVPAPAPAAANTAESDEMAHAVHGAYVDAINTNDVDKLMAVLTDDIVYQSPHEPEIIGKDAVKAWVTGYFGAFSTKWEKTTLEFVAAGEWAFERYAYKVVDTPKGGGAPSEDKGKGINIFHHDADGVWRVARDGWSSDLPIAAK